MNFGYSSSPRGATTTAQVLSPRGSLISQQLGKSALENGVLHASVASLSDESLIKEQPFQFLAWFFGPHEGFADQEGMNAGLAHAGDIVRRVDTGFRDQQV